MIRRFDIYGIGVEVAGDDELVSWIGEDFSYFEIQGEVPPALKFNVTHEKKPVPLRMPAFRTRMCVATGWMGERVCDYGGGTFVHSRFAGNRREFEIVASETELAYEALYSAVLSAVGEELDLRGFHRVHALGIEVSGKTALLLLPSGGGKSAIAALLAKRADVKIFSDESPLLDGMRMYPFPVRGALRPEVAHALGVPLGGRIFRRKLFPEKALFAFERTQVARPVQPDWILIGFRNGKHRPRASLAAKFAAFIVLLDSCMVGRGLAQMSEFMIRGDSVWKVPRIALGRFFAVFFAVFRAKCAWIDISDDAHQNARELSDFLTKAIF